MRSELPRAGSTMVLRGLIALLVAACAGSPVRAADETPGLPAPTPEVEPGLEWAWWHGGPNEGDRIEIVTGRIGDRARKVLHIKYAGRGADKVSCSLYRSWRASPDSRLRLCVYVPSANPPSLAVAVASGGKTSAKQIWHESKPVALKTGWNALEFSFQSGWKTAASKGENTQAIGTPDQVRGISLLVLRGGEAGEVFVVGVRLEGAEVLPGSEGRPDGLAPEEGLLIARASSLVTAEKELRSLQEDPSTKPFRPKVASLIEEMNLLRLQLLEQPDKQKEKRVGELGMELYMTLQTSFHRCRYPDHVQNDFNLALEQYLTSRKGCENAPLLPETQALIQKADPIAAACALPDHAAADAKAKEKAAATAATVQTRRNAETEQEFILNRKKILAAQGEHEAAVAKLAQLQTQYLAARREAQALKQRIAELEKQEQEAWRRDGSVKTPQEREALTALLNQLSNQKQEAWIRQAELGGGFAIRGKIGDALESANHALRRIRLTIQSLDSQAARDEYARKLMDDPALQTAPEKSRLAAPPQPTGILTRKDGSRIEALKLVDLDESWLVQEVNGEFRLVEKSAVR